MKKSVIICIHVIFWVILLTSGILFTPFLTRYLSPAEYNRFNYFFKPMIPGFFYLGYWGVMRLLKIRHWLLYVVGLILLIFLVLVLISFRAFAFGLVPLSTGLLWITLGVLFRFFIDWFRKKNDLLSLQKEFAESELALLKSRINPHFLFNTLHNIDALIPRDPGKASESLIRLSGIMRYMLQNAKNERVPVEQEVEYIGNYLDLERLRFKNEHFLNYERSGDFAGQQMAPMLLIPFVENAFKHSVDSAIEDGISMKLAIHENVLTFTCVNRCEDNAAGKDDAHGIGLDTVRKRLQLLYPARHTLTIERTDIFFKVRMEICLDEN